jgi:hypothetical protein
MGYLQGEIGWQVNHKRASRQFSKTTPSKVSIFQWADPIT